MLTEYTVSFLSLFLYINLTKNVQKNSIYHCFCNVFISLHAQNTPTLYKGTVNGKMPVTLFIQSVENGCGGDPFYNAMYRYDKVSNWLELV
jgi:hypothetical protein